MEKDGYLYPKVDKELLSEKYREMQELANPEKRVKGKSENIKVRNPNVTCVGGGCEDS